MGQIIAALSSSSLPVCTNTQLLAEVSWLLERKPIIRLAVL